MDQSSGTAGTREQDGHSSPGELERWARVKAVFLDALDYPESERGAFVAQACSTDPKLKDEVESLLESADAAASFCETPAAQLLGAEAFIARESCPRLPQGARLGPYEITQFIAAGGMGEVYCARHTLLGRQVAIKTVGTQLSDAPAKRHLIREARHASVLAHPNICTIHEVGEADGAPFIVMEYVAGQPLNEIVREKVPPLRDSLAYAIQIASALEHAHEHGIIHRDLKSSNVVIDSEGRAKVLDFGLARRLPEAANSQSRESTITSLGALAGTLSHMAPEVLRGERADARSDVWALGVLLYELVTGELPFQGRTQFETSSAILSDPPRPMSARVPLALRLVIERCLVKQPDGRYQSARAVCDALDAIRRRRAWPVVGRLLISVRRRSLYAAAAAVLLLPAVIIGGSRLRVGLGASPVTPVSTLALLPLENATGDSGADYYALGVTDALIAQLGAASDVRVLSRASTKRVARSTTSPTEIGAQLGADVIVQGALRQAAERVTIDLRLVQPRDGRVLWTHTYERTAREVLALEGDVVRGLADAIQLTLRPAARDRLASIRAVSPDVYEAYLKGRYEWNKRTQRSLELAVEHFTRAVELDPTYAPAHAALADCFSLLGTVMLGAGSPRDFRPRAAAAAIKALQIDPHSAEAHAALGYVWHYEWRWADAERELRRAIELNPSYSLVRIWYANLLMSRSRWDEAIQQVMAARDLDPFSLIVNTNVGWVLDRSGRHHEAITHLRQTLALDSQYVQARWRLVVALTWAGRHAEALDEVNRVVTLTNSSMPALALLANTRARAGKRDEARTLLETVLARSRDQYVPPASIAGVFIGLGEVDSALTWLEKAFAERSNAIAYLADPENDPLRHHPRFEALLAGAGLK
jgi:serine/threonine protein kinase/tetratricopeptide (TPR) repeat protein